MRKKKLIKLGIIIQVVIVLVSNLSIVRANNSVNIPFYTPHKGIISFMHEDRMNITNYFMLEDYQANTIYQCSETSQEIDKTLVSKEKITNSNMVCVLKNGYPNKTKEELGCELAEEAYIATQEAFYMVCDNKNPKKYITPSAPEQKLINTAKQIATKALTEINSNRFDEIQVKEVDKQWKEEEEYLVKKYQIKVEGEMCNSNISVIGENGILITDESGNVKNSFIKEDMIKVKIPKTISNQHFQLKLTAELKGIEYYLCKDKNNKEYIYLEKGTYEAQTIQNIKNGEVTNLTIVNFDADSKLPMVGNTFQLLDAKQNVVTDNLVTDTQGKIKINNLEKGVYYIKQISSIEGYTKLGIMTEIEITGKENNVKVTLNSTKMKEETTTNTNKEINVTEENKQITQNNVTEITNVHTTNTFKEIVNQINETNWYNNRDFINTINKKNRYLKTTNHIYLNKIEEETIQNEQKDEIANLNMTREDYINYMDCIRLKNQEIPKLPVTGK